VTGRAPELDSFLGEIDRRLREIQTELSPERAAREPDGEHPAAPEPAQSRRPRGRAGPLTTALLRARNRSGPVPPPAEPAPTSEPDEEPAADPAPAAELSKQVAALAALQAELLGAFERLLSAREVAPPQAAPPSATLSAGPFADTDELREFERALAAIPGVIGVAVRGYAGHDRAIVEVEFAGAHPGEQTS
jgi:hypothetical protein